MQKGFKQVNLEGCVSGTLAVPVIGENGNWFIGNDDTGVCAKGGTGVCAKGGTGAGSSATVLWENSDPTAEMAEQAIEVDLSGYEFIEIIPYKKGNDVKVTNHVGNMGYLIRADYQSNNIAFGTRRVDITSTGILVNGGGYGYIGNIVPNNGIVIPYKIIGYK